MVLGSSQGLERNVPGSLHKAMPTAELGPPAPQAVSLWGQPSKEQSVRRGNVDTPSVPGNTPSVCTHGDDPGKRLPEDSHVQTREEASSVYTVILDLQPPSAVRKTDVCWVSHPSPKSGAFSGSLS